MEILLAVVEADRNTWRERYHAAIRERDRERARANTLERSRSFRLGRTLVLLVKSPVKTAPRVLRAILRRLLVRSPAPVRRLLSRSGLSRSSSAAPAGATQSAGAATSAQVPRRPVLSEHLPVHAYVALGFDLDGLRSFARAVGQCALACADHVPLIVTDNSSFVLLREYRVAIEYIPDWRTWKQYSDDVSWERFLSGRLTRLLAEHQPSRSFFVSQSDAYGLTELLDLNAQTT